MVYLREHAENGLVSRRFRRLRTPLLPDVSRSFAGPPRGQFVDVVIQVSEPHTPPGALRGARRVMHASPVASGCHARSRGRSPSGGMASRRARAAGSRGDGRGSRSSRGGIDRALRSFQMARTAHLGPQRKETKEREASRCLGRSRRGLAGPGNRAGRTERSGRCSSGCCGRATGTPRALRGRDG
jgi:hypothetical protein